MRRALAAVCGGVALAGCGSSITHGRIVHKDDQPEWLETGVVIAGKAVIPVIIPHDEEWTITFRECAKTCEQRTVDVSKEVYARARIGQPFRVGS